MRDMTDAQPTPVGRRKLYSDRAQTRSLSLDPLNWRWLDEQARLQDRSRSSVLNRLIDDHRRAGLITPDHTEPSQRRMISADGSTIVPADDEGALLEKMTHAMTQPIEKPLERKTVEPRFKGGAK
jgi:hypothetical protein